MSEPSAPPSPAAPLPAGLLAAWLGQSHDLLALTDAAGRVRWCNSAFERATGLGLDADLLTLATPDGPARDALSAGLRHLDLPGAELALQTAAGAALWVEARVGSVDSDRLWTLRDTTAQHDLAARAQQLSELLDMAQQFGRLGVWQREIPSGKGHWDPHVFGFWGMTPTDGTPDYIEAARRIHPDDRNSVYLDSTALAGRYAQRYRVIRPDGSLRSIHSQWEVRNSAAGVPDRTIGIMVDDTEVYELARSRVEHSRRAEQLARRPEAAAEGARVGIWTAVIGSRQTEWNAQMYELFDMVGAGAAPTLGEWLDRCVHPDDAARVTQTTRAFVKRESRAFEIEFRTRPRDGRVRWMVQRADLDRSGTDPTRVYGIAMDVTERHAALAALHAAGERSALIARHAGIGTWETDDHGGPVLWDEQMWRLRGLAPRPVSPGPQERLALVHPDDREHVLNASAELATEPRATAYEFRIRMPDGGYRWLASRSAALDDEQGKAIRRVGVNWDITEARNAELARQQALLAERESQAKSQFLARMSHELRTPLNAVLGFTQLLQLELGHGSDAHDRSAKLGHIRTAGEHLLTLIDDALDLSSLQSGTLRLELQTVPIAAAVAQALPLVDALAAAHGVSLQRGTLDGSVRADPTRLRQVLLNLLTNAITYNRRGGQVVVDALERGRHRPRPAARPARAPFRALQPARHGARRHRRLGHRPDDRTRAGPGHGRAGRRLERARPRHGGRDHAAGGPGARGGAIRGGRHRPRPRSRPRAPASCSTSRTTASTCCWSRSW